MNKEEIQNLIKELIEKTNVKVKEISIYEDGPKNTWFKVEVAEPHLFTLRDGEALNALNHLVRRMTESKTPAEQDGPEFLIDINGFQQKRVDSIRAVAHMMAERARYFKSSVQVDPMSSFERRIVHEFLSNETDIKTESEGYGPSRRVVIKYIGSI
jgi:spoIIIJ-associated protein